MEEELAIIREQKKIANKARTEDVAILKQTLEPVEEKLDNVSESIENLISFLEGIGKNKEDREYFDKELGTIISASVDKLFNVIKNFKQAEIKIDLSPITSIASEIKKGNDNILQCLNRPDQSAEVYKMVSSMIAKQNAMYDKFMSMKEAEKTEVQHTVEKEEKKNTEWEFTVIRNQSGSFNKVIAKSK